MKRNHKIITGVLAVAATIATLATVYLKRPTGHRGFYDNDMSSYLGITAKEDAQIAWHVKNGDNSIAGYGFGDRITSTSKWPVISNYIRKCKRKGIDIGFIYSSTSTLSSFTTYQAAQSTDSTKFKFVVSEIEPYNSGDYVTFNTTCRAFYNQAQKNKVESDIYMGWPSAAGWDSITSFSDRTYLHCYIPSDRMSGSGQYSYMKSRLNTIAGIIAKKYAGNTAFKYNVVVIYSNESNFGGTYFKTHTWDQPFTDLQNYFNASADSIVKKRILLGGRQIFKSSLGMVIRP